MSIDRPWIELNAGETETAGANQHDGGDRNRVPRRCARCSRLDGPAKPIPSAAGGRRSASDRAWPAGSTRNTILRRCERRRIGAAGRERLAGAGKIVERALELVAGEIELLALALLVEPFEHQRAAPLGFDKRRGAVKRQLRAGWRGAFCPRCGRHVAGDVAGFPRRRVRLGRVAIRPCRLDLGEVDLALILRRR